MKNKIKIPENTVLVLSNIDGVIDMQKYSVDELMDEKATISIPVSDERFDNLPDCKKAEDNIIPKSTHIDPFIQFAMTTHPDRDMNKVSIGIAETSSGKRVVTETCYSDGITRPLSYPAIIGDEVGPLGYFVPFSASYEGVKDAAELFTEIVAEAARMSLPNSSDVTKF